MLEKFISFDAFKDYYNQNDIKGCKTCLMFMVMEYNEKISNGEVQPHKLKHLLFKTNCIKNPMGMKYTEVDYKNTIEIISFLIKLIDAINDPLIDTSEDFDTSLEIDSSIREDLVNLVIYTEILYKMNKSNSTRMDLDKFTQEPFLVQLLTPLLFYQDQNRLLEKKLMQKSHMDYFTGMELAVANNPVDQFDGVNVSISDNNESNLEALNEIVHFLYYKFKNEMPQHIDVNVLQNINIKPYENADFMRNTGIANQRHILLRLEESMRCGYLTFDRIEKDTNGHKVYVFEFENVKKSRARFCGLYRREREVRTHALIDIEAHKGIIESKDAINRLAQNLLSLQQNDFTLFDFSNFHIEANDYNTAQKTTDVKINIVTDTTKPYYLKSIIKNVKIEDLLICYRFLDTFAEIIKCAISQLELDVNNSSILKELCIMDKKYLIDELARLTGFDSQYSTKLLDRFIFHNSNNRDDDVFSQPLIMVSCDQVVFCPALIDQVNLDRAIERQFIRYKVDVSIIGSDFEAFFKDALIGGYHKSIIDHKSQPIPHLLVNTNSIVYKAFDGKDIEFDVVMVLGEYLILTELKAIMTSYDIMDLIERERNIKEAIQQLKRRKESVIKDWNTFRSLVSFVLPETPFKSDRIMLIACSDAYDFTPLQVDDIFITDQSTYLKYFTSPYVDEVLKDGDSVTLSKRKSLWCKGYPRAEEFMNYLRWPVTTQYISNILKSVYLPVTRMCEDDMRIVVAEYQLHEDPIVEIIAPSKSKKKVSKNSKCPCGSGKKFRKCCKGKGIYD